MPNPTMNKAEAEKILASVPKYSVEKNLAKIEQHQMETLANERAEREPLPGPAADVFAVEPMPVKLSDGKELIIRPMVAYDINIFKQINSPFYRLAMGDVNPDDPNSLFSSEEETYELIYQFTHSPKTIYSLLKKGTDAYKLAVLEETAFVLSPVDAAQAVEKIMEHIFNVNMSRVEFEADPTGGDDKKKQ